MRLIGEFSGRTSRSHSLKVGRRTPDKLGAAAKAGVTPLSDIMSSRHQCQCRGGEA